MRKLIYILSILLVVSTAFSANKRILKSEFKKDRMNRVEPDYRKGEVTRDACPHQYPNNENTVWPGAQNCRSESLELPELINFRFLSVF